jgi:nitroimidazol reductase NimA-like FMN-containing flavoprotein (pyridoxamine 5'-phosphate oxidase superfamily)
VARERIGMSSGEVDELLAGQRWVVIATLDADGSPWADLAACAFEAGELHFGVCRGTRSHRNIERDARVCCSIDVFPSYYEIRGVTLHGAARRVDDASLRAKLGKRLAHPGVPVADPSGDSSDLYALPLGDVFSFDFGKIQSRY